MKNHQKRCGRARTYVSMFLGRVRTIRYRATMQGAELLAEEDNFLSLWRASRNNVAT